MPKRLTAEEFLRVSKRVHQGFYDYSKIVFLNSKTKVEVVCPIHGSFLQSPQKHKGGQGCPKCGQRRAKQRQRLQQSEVLRLFRELHGESYDYDRVEYSGYHVKVEIVCPVHGSFRQTPAAHINNKSGCPHCGHSAAAKKRRITPQEFFQRCDEAHDARYSYDDSDYRGLDSIIEIRCKTHNLVFTQKAMTHLRGNTGCEKCVAEKLSSYHESRRISPDAILRIFEERHKGKYDYSLVPGNVRCEDRVQIICSQHGVFEQRVTNHMRGDGCAQCAGNARLSIEEMKDLARERNGECLSEEYSSSSEKLRWRCADGHEWLASADQIKYNHSWCPKCQFNFGEELVRAYFESVFERPFPRTRPDWLDGLELDGFNASLGIAFEHHGQQHYRFKKLYHRSRREFEAQMERDRRKRSLCTDKGVVLLEIPEVPSLTSLGELPELLDSLMTAQGLIPTRTAASVDLEAFEIHSEHSKLSELGEIARSRGGVLLSKTFFGMAVHLKWKCREGHEWSAVPSSILGGTWCPTCAGKIKISIDELKRIAIEKSGECISKDYINARTNLSWRCHQGHEWQASPYSVRNLGTWCPYCAGKHRTIDDARDLATKKGGDCISKNYVTSKANLSWRCSKGHEWDASYDSIARGAWCPKCGDKRRLTLEDMKAIATKRGGECLSSKYISINHHLLWRCRFGHEWKARANNVDKGHWCPVCAGNRRSTIEEMRLLASDRSGECLSSSYSNMHTKLRWKCEKGHTWEATPRSVLNGHWCPSCAGNKKLSIEDMHALAREFGGRCLSKTYFNARSKLTWECANGHRWEAIPDVVRNRRIWCQECKKEGLA